MTCSTKISLLAVLFFAAGTPGFCQADMQKYKNRSHEILQELQHEIGTNAVIIVRTPEPGEPGNPPDEPTPINRGIKVTYPVYTDGYLVSGSVSGIMASNYRADCKIDSINAVIEGGKVPLPIAAFTPFGWVPAGWEVILTNSWYFTGSYNAATIVFLRFIYHHGYNTISEWWSALSFGSLNNFNYGRLIHHFGPKSVDQGGDFREWSDGPLYIWQLPTFIHKAGTQVPYKGHYSFWDDYGKCYLKDVEVWRAAPASQTYETISFSQFYTTLPNNEIVDIALPGVGLFDYNRDFIPGTTSIQSFSVSKHTQQKTMVTYINQSELDLNFDGNIATFRSAMTNMMSNYINPYPNRIATQSQLKDIGAKAYISATIQ